MEPNVPTSKPAPKRELYKEEENRDEIRKTTGIIAPNSINLSFGILNFPSPRRAINQKNRERVAPIEIRNPLLASRVIGVNGIKKNRETKKVTNNVRNESLLKNLIFLGSIYFKLYY